jgi:hypothetical protein
MDKNFIKNNQLDEAVERFRQIAEYKSPKQSLHKLYERKHKLNEYTFITAPQVNEDGEENDGELQKPENMNGGEQMNNQQGGNIAPDASNQMGDMNGQNNGQMPTDGSQMPQNDVQQGNDMNGDMQMNGTEGDMPDFSEPEVEDDGIETQEMESDDEVIDVDDLTQSQEATEYKIDGVDDRLSKIYAVVRKFSDQLEKNEESIMALKDEFEKRNPTEEEKLNIRSQSSYPYSETPKDYWNKKTQENPHYNVMYNNEVSPSEEQKKFEITKNDISGLNMKSISDTLDIDQSLNKYLGF